MRPEWAALHKAGQTALGQLERAMQDPADAQQKLLAEILLAVAPSAMGRRHRLTPDMTVAAFQDAVPIRDYAGFAPFIADIVAGAPEVLTQNPVIAWELTGGSSGGRKPIPYTAALLDAFQRGIMAWFGDFLTAKPQIGAGRAYFAISPALTPAADLGGLPVGLGSDLSYFGDQAEHLGPVMLFDASLNTVDYDAWAAATIAMLTQTRDLSLISVWSPTFLTALLDQINHVPDWPALAMVSAWGDASAAAGADDLRQRLPQAHFQPKGLLSTEAIMTIPLFGQADPVPALTSTFMEFRASDGAVHLVANLKRGAVYDLIITTPGGLIRYDIGDQVICAGHVGQTPMLRFVGRTGGTDLVGEKLTDAFVSSCLRQTQISGVLVALTDPARYLLVTDDAQADLLQLDAALSENPQYAYARRLRQLPLPQLVRRDNLMADVVAHRRALGHRLSDIKVPVLLNETRASAIWPDLN